MFRKTVCMLLIVLLCLAAAGCGQRAESKAPAAPAAQDQAEAKETAPAAAQGRPEASETVSGEAQSAAEANETALAATAAPTAVPDPDATVELTADESGEEYVVISCMVPGGAAIRIAQGEREFLNYTNSNEMESRLSINIPLGHFLSGEVTGESFVIAPEITITTADGVSYPAVFEPLIYGLTQLELTILSPVPDETGSVMAAEDNTIVFTGMVSDPEAQVTARGFLLQVAEDGAFEFSFEFPEDAPEDAAETILFEATRPSSVSARQEVVVRAYQAPAGE